MDGHVRNTVLDQRRHKQDTDNTKNGGGEEGFGAGRLSCPGVPYKVHSEGVATWRNVIPIPAPGSMTS